MTILTGSITIDPAHFDSALARLDRLIGMAPRPEVTVNGIRVIAREGAQEGPILAIGTIESGKAGEIERKRAVIVNLKG